MQTTIDHTAPTTEIQAAILADGIDPESKVINLPKVNSEIKPLPATFQNCLVKIQISKGKHRDTLYTLISDVFEACRNGFSGNNEDERGANMEVLDAACVEQGITGQTYYQKIGKLAFGSDSKEVSGFIHVIKVAEKNDVAPPNFISWIKEKGGIQAIRSNYKSDGTRKPEKKADESKTTSATTAIAIDDQMPIANDDQTYITKGKTALTASVAATIPKGQLEVIEPIGNEAECTAILLQTADGSFVIKAVLKDKKLVDSLYAAYARSKEGKE